MTEWARNDLERIGSADELRIATFKKDNTLREPVPVWVVRAGDDLFVRSYLGSEGAWFRQAQRRPEGRISAGGVTKDVTFVDVSDDEVLNNRLDVVYQTKYRKYSARYVDAMVAPVARATTLKLLPAT